MYSLVFNKPTIGQQKIHYVSYKKDTIGQIGNFEKVARKPSPKPGSQYGSLKPSHTPSPFSYNTIVDWGIKKDSVSK